MSGGGLFLAKRWEYTVISEELIREYDQQVALRSSQSGRPRLREGLGVHKILNLHFKLFGNHESVQDSTTELHRRIRAQRNDFSLRVPSDDEKEISQEY